MSNTIFGFSYMALGLLGFDSGLMDSNEGGKRTVKARHVEYGTESCIKLLLTHPGLRSEISSVLSFLQNMMNLPFCVRMC
jgi:hypothetical protein